jgi:hypothetical protein
MYLLELCNTAPDPVKLFYPDPDTTLRWLMENALTLPSAKLDSLQRWLGTQNRKAAIFRDISYQGESKRHIGERPARYSSWRSFPSGFSASHRTRRLERVKGIEPLSLAAPPDLGKWRFSPNTESS